MLKLRPFKKLSQRTSEINILRNDLDTNFSVYNRSEKVERNLEFHGNEKIVENIRLKKLSERVVRAFETLYKILNIFFCFVAWVLYHLFLSMCFHYPISLTLGRPSWVPGDPRARFSPRIFT